VKIGDNTFLGPMVKLFIQFSQTAPRFDFIGVSLWYQLPRRHLSQIEILYNLISS